jgi:hypothetical protein
MSRFADVLEESTNSCPGLYIMVDHVSSLMNDRLTRRTLLGATATASTALLAGCTDSRTAGGGSGTPEDIASQSKIFASVSVTENVELTLADDADIDAVRLITPEGKSADSSSVSAGVTSVSLSLFESMAINEEEMYKPGEYTLVAVRDDESVEEYPLDLEPELELAGIQDLDSTSAILYQLHNIGTGPAYMFNVKTVTGEEDLSPQYGTKMLRGDGVDSWIVPPGETKAYGDSDDETFRLYESDDYELREVCTSEFATKDVTCAVKLPHTGWHTTSLSITATERVGSGRHLYSYYSDCGSLTSDAAFPLKLSSPETDSPESS